MHFSEHCGEEPNIKVWKNGWNIPKILALFGYMAREIKQ
jgi:hypothetical protein